jgi:UTP--glucose-1-phosphate uridylyltransferase
MKFLILNCLVKLTKQSLKILGQKYNLRRDIRSRPAMLQASFKSSIAMSIRKVVFPVAGLGTRFLPASKVVAKEMLPIVDKPLIQFAAEEAIEAGADTLIFVINRNKRQIADHFDAMFELETKLAAQGKDQLLSAARDLLPPHVSCVFVTQKEALGLGHAVLCAKPVVGNEPFAVILPDDFIYSPGNGALKQMAEHHAKTGASVVAVENVPREKTSQYGIVSSSNSDAAISRIEGLVEKPKPEHAPSTLAVVGRYILDGRVMDLLETTQSHTNGEIQLTDAIASLLKEKPVDAFRFAGTRYDCGTKLGFVKATARLALDDSMIGDQVRVALGEML